MSRDGSPLCGQPGVGVARNEVLEGIDLRWYGTVHLPAGSSSPGSTISYQVITPDKVLRTFLFRHQSAYQYVIMTLYPTVRGRSSEAHDLDSSNSTGSDNVSIDRSYGNISITES